MRRAGTFVAPPGAPRGAVCRKEVPWEETSRSGDFIQ